MPIVEQRDAIEGYVTKAGYIALEQESHEFGKKVAIYIHPADVDDVCQALQNLKDEAVNERRLQSQIDAEAELQELDN